MRGHAAVDGAGGNGHRGGRERCERRNRPSRMPNPHPRNRSRPAIQQRRSTTWAMQNARVGKHGAAVLELRTCAPAGARMIPDIARQSAASCATAAHLPAEPLRWFDARRLVAVSPTTLTAWLGTRAAFCCSVAPASCGIGRPPAPAAGCARSPLPLGALLVGLDVDQRMGCCGRSLHEAVVLTASQQRCASHRFPWAIRRSYWRRRRP